MTIAITNDVVPPSVAATFNDGMGLSTIAAGTVDIVVGTLTIGADTFGVEHSGSRMTLTNTVGMFDFGSGTTSAKLTIMLSRL